MSQTTPAPTRRTFSVSPALALVLAAAAFQLAPAAHAAVAGGPETDVPGAQPQALSVQGSLDRAAALLAEGRLVAARAALHALLDEALPRLTPAQAGETHRLIAAVNRRIQGADPLEISLQKADLALEQGDVATADLHAAAVAASPKATGAQVAGAERILARAERQRAELAPIVDGAIDRAVRHFEAGRYAQAKAELSTVRRSGIPLSESRAGLVDEYQMRLVALERAAGAEFEDGPVTAGLLHGQPEDPADLEAPIQPEDPAAVPPPVQPMEPSDDLITTAVRGQAQELFAEADQAYMDRRFDAALRLYRQLTQDRYAQHLTPEQRRLAQDRLAEIRVRQGETGVDVTGVQRQTDLRYQIAVAEFENSMAGSRQALREGDVSTARARAAEAILTVQGNRDAFPPDEYQRRLDEARALQADIDREGLRIAAREREAAETERIRAQQAAEQAARRGRERQIDELLDRARAYQSELRYEDALATVNQILFLDPIHPAAMLLRDVYEDIIRYRTYGALRTMALVESGDLRLQNQEAAIPISELLTFPTNWPSKSFQRGATDSYADTPENRQVLAQLARLRIPAINFNDNSLGDIIVFLEDLTQLNIDAEWNELGAIGIQPESTVTLNLRNVDAQTVLNRVLDRVSDEDSRAAWAVHDGILTISSDDALRRHRVTHIYDIKDLLIDIPDYDEVPSIDLQSVLQSGRGGGGQSPFRDDQDDEDRERRTLDERTDDIIDILTRIVDPQGWVDNGGTTGEIMKHTGSLIIINTAANHRAINGLLSQLRAVRAMQINVETRFLLVNQDFFEQIGFDLDVYLNAENNQVRFAQGQVPTANARDFFDDQGRPSRVVGSPTPGVFVGTAVPSSNQGVVNQPGAGWSVIGFTQNSLGMAGNIAPSSDWSNAILGGAPALGVAGSFLDDIQVDFLVRATQADRRSVQLTAPRLTFTNGQTSNIYVATQQAFVSDLQPIVGDSAVGFDPQVDVVTEGVTLLVEGTISADRRYVTLNVDSGVARIDGFAQEGVTAVAGGQLVASADTQSFIQLPTVTVTRVRTTATVPDQGTVLLGGQRLITEFEVETGVPVLSKIPILNRFFTNRIESKEEQTLLILLKPTIIIQAEEEERHFPGLADSISTGFGG